MSDIIERYPSTDNVGDPVEVRILQDDDPSHADPRNDDGQVGVMICGHPRYYLGDHGHALQAEVLDVLRRARTWAGFVRYMRLVYGSTVVKPLYLLDHSGLSIWASDEPVRLRANGWDTSMVGVIFDTIETHESSGVLPEYVEAAIDSEVKHYDTYLRGEVYGYEVVKTEKCDQGEEHEEVIDSCWGFVGREYVEECARDCWPEREGVSA